MKALYPAVGEVKFFCSVPGEEGVAPDISFNHKRLEKKWRKASDHLGVPYIAPYSCMKHSTALALRAMGRTPDEIKELTGHATSEAFSRYYETSLRDLETMFDQVRVTSGE